MLKCFNEKNVRPHVKPRDGLDGSTSDNRIAAILRLATRFFEARAAVISVLNEDTTRPLAAVGTPMNADLTIPPWCHRAAETGPFIMSCVPDNLRFSLQFDMGSELQVQFMAGCSLVNPEGRCLGNLCIFDTTPWVAPNFEIETLHDIAQLAGSELERRILDSVQHDLISQIRTEQHRALIDPLTQIWNREGIDQVLADRSASTATNDSPTVIMMVDLDHFKKVNDQWGHAVGDQVLREATKRMQSALQLTDAIGRVGGEEFLIVLGQDCSINQAIDIAHRVRQSVADAPIETNVTDIHISISIGLAYTSDSESPVDEQIKRADMALYKAKHDGRNRVAVAD